MKIRNKGRKKEYDVYAIAFYTPDDWEFKDRVVFYVAEEGLIGLSAEGFKDVEIIDPILGSDFKFHNMDHDKGFMMFWDHFTDINHLARLIDLDPETVAAFEKARAARSIG
ncbi:hypothetical protein ACFSQT_14540 [Mesorhizobium calcicola]|uniref:Uncharacterized protein n=1 Tax=Mesorhizobium calcicola TaxID=1300310 RepID=A0ABW4WCN2_9HYPH